MKTHPLNVTYLVMGLIFLGLSGSWALREAGVIDLGQVRWLLPLTLVVAGVVGLLALAARSRRSGTTGVEPGYGDTEDTVPTDHLYPDHREGEL